MTAGIHAWAQRHRVSFGAVLELIDMLDPSVPRIPSGAASEAAVQAKLRVTAAARGGSLWRNNRGAMTDPENGRHVRFGLGNDSSRLDKVWKSSDLIGITPVISTRAGEVFGVFTAVEVKTPGWSGPKTRREQAQGEFLKTVKALHGISLFAQSVDDYERMTRG